MSYMLNIHRIHLNCSQWVMLVPLIMQSKTDILDITNTWDSAVECCIEKCMWQNGLIEREELIGEGNYSAFLFRKKNIYI